MRTRTETTDELDKRVQVAMQGWRPGSSLVTHYNSEAAQSNRLLVALADCITSCMNVLDRISHDHEWRDTSYSYDWSLRNVARVCAERIKLEQAYFDKKIQPLFDTAIKSEYAPKAAKRLPKQPRANGARRRRANGTSATVTP